MDENSDPKSVNAIGCSEDRVQDGYKNHGFDTAGVNFDQEYTPRTAALPQQNSGFQ
jgi:hypothetical protein